MRWYETDRGPKTYRRPRTCSECRANPYGGCPLPVRFSRKVRRFERVRYPSYRGA